MIINEKWGFVKGEGEILGDIVLVGIFHHFTALSR